MPPEYSSEPKGNQGNTEQSLKRTIIYVVRSNQMLTDNDEENHNAKAAPSLS